MGKKEFSELEQIKNTLSAFSRKKIKRTDKKIDKIRSDIKEFSQFSKYHLTGELLKYSLNSLKRGMKKVALKDYETGVDVVIELAVNKTPIENMEIYFKKAKKMKRGLEHAKKRLSISLSELSEFQAILEKILNTDDEVYLNELEQLYFPKPPSTQLKRIKKVIGKRYFYEGHIFCVGRNENENEEILKFVGGGNDWWFHISDYTGSHVVCIGAGADIGYELVKFGALLALMNSKAARSDGEEVIYTQKKNLKKLKGGRPGQVLCSKNHSIFIKKHIDITPFKL